MTTPQITITKIDHDNWLGYYIDDALYGYNDYYNFSDGEVQKEALLQALDRGLISKRTDPLDVVWDYHTNWPELVNNDQLYDIMLNTFSSELPASLADLKGWVSVHADDQYEDEVDEPDV